MPYFKKEIPETPVYLPVGKAITFEAIDRDYGYLATNDGYVIDQLQKLISSRRGGVSEITQAEYEEWVQKKTQLSLQPLQPRQRTTIGPQGRNQLRNQAGAVVPDAASVVGVMANGQPISSFAMGQRSEGLKVERTFVKPKVGTIK